MAWFRLARMLGISVKRAQKEIDSREFSDWWAYLRLEQDPDDVRTARICAVLAQLAGNKDVKEDDFLPRKRASRQQSEREIAAGLKARLSSLMVAGKQPAKRKRA
jgi:hypothetical protein